MKQLKHIIATLVLGGFAFFMFMIGLGVLFFMMLVWLVSGLFVKPETRAKMRQQWQARRHMQTQKSTAQKGTTIEGQYDIVDTH